ncbi:MAG: hypothetical protein ACXAAH_06535 [Promethearchaeota archaeon]|jgi:hypothetical protein
MSFSFSSILTFFGQLIRINGFLGYFLGMFFSSLTLLVAFKPDDPIPWHWLVLLSFSILLVTFSFLLGGIAVFIAAVMGAIDSI